MEKQNERFANIVIGEYRINNNAWGSEEDEVPQCIFVPDNGFAAWDWDWPGNDNTKIMSYPEIIFGKKPHDEKESTTSKLPVKLQDINELDVNYAIKTNNRDPSYNTAFNMWVTSSAEADSDSLLAEILVSLSTTGVVPCGHSLGPILTPNGEAELWLDTRYEKGRQWAIYTFAHKGEKLSGEIDLKFYLSELLSREKQVEPEHFLASVEFGNEIAFGSGQSIVETYSVNLSI